MVLTKYLKEENLHSLVFDFVNFCIQLIHKRLQQLYLAHLAPLKRQILIKLLQYNYDYAFRRFYGLIRAEKHLTQLLIRMYALVQFDWFVLIMKPSNIFEKRLLNIRIFVKRLEMLADEIHWVPNHHLWMLRKY
jgi:hypothetical protein